MAIDIHEDKNENTHQQHLYTTSPLELTEDEWELEQQEAQIREAIYSFLSSVYLHPVSEVTLQQICDDLFLNDLVEVLPGEATVELRQYLSALDTTSLADELAVLKQEYMSLFTVPTGRYVTPFEDIYRGKTTDGQPHRGPLLGVRAIAAKQLYREAGAEMDNITKELPNHIGVELSFMRFLCEREAAALIDNNSDIFDKNNDQDNIDTSTFSQAEIYRAYQVRFLGEHLTRWFPELNEEIQKKSVHVFYRSISSMTQEYLQQDLAMLKQQLINSFQ